MTGFWERNPSEEVEDIPRSHGRRPTQQMSVASEGSTDSALHPLLTGKVCCVMVIEVGELRCRADGLSDSSGGPHRLCFIAESPMVVQCP